MNDFEISETEIYLLRKLSDAGGFRRGYMQLKSGRFVRVYFDKSKLSYNISILDIFIKALIKKIPPSLRGLDIVAPAIGAVPAATLLASSLKSDVLIIEKKGQRILRKGDSANLTKNVILFDDVYNTGAEMAIAETCCKENSLNVVFKACLLNKSSVNSSEAIVSALHYPIKEYCGNSILSSVPTSEIPCPSKSNQALLDAPYIPFDELIAEISAFRNELRNTL